MAEFEAKVYKLAIEEHPNADVLELARVGDYLSIVRKGEFKTGDLGVYIPEQAVCPAWLIERLGLTGKLAGRDKNRVKAIKLRGILSQGLIYPLTFHQGIRATNTDSDTPEYDDIWVLTVEDEIGERQFTLEAGADVTKFMGITKYEPVIPASMSGEVVGASGLTLKYDIENIKKYPDIFTEHEKIAITEKIHGTWACFGWNPDATKTDGYIISSKGLSSHGVIFKLNEKNESNLYVRAFNETTNERGNVVDQVRNYFYNELGYSFTMPFYILAEIFGRGVQDLHYGQQHPSFRIFDVFIGAPGSGRYLNFREKQRLCSDCGLLMVPILHVGFYSTEIIEEYTTGNEFISGDYNPPPNVQRDSVHMREGIVITPLVERQNDEIGRVILKSVSEDYLLRRGNTTEYN